MCIDRIMEMLFIVIFEQEVVIKVVSNQKVQGFNFYRIFDISSFDSIQNYCKIFCEKVLIVVMFVLMLFGNSCFFLKDGNMFKFDKYR